MDSERWDKIKALFSIAVDLDDVEGTRFLSDACGDDSALRREVEELLEAHKRERGLQIERRFLNDPEPGSVAEDTLIGQKIGVYEIKEVIGEGGMGTVYLAERGDDFAQRVALKMIRPGLQSAEIVGRFKRERQILANLQHPHIARLLDGGMTGDGRPYLVMEFVEGIPITTYCDQMQLPVGDRLRLFREVCGAVQFAHRNLVVHRDLKPSNILVTEAGEVKLLDFGIAKLLSGTSADAPPDWTRVDMRVLTPEYAAPEQIRGGVITTATDVYTLGILLYELLTGRRPFRLAERLRAEVERLVCEEVPTLPSTAVTTIEEIVSADGTTETLTPERVSAARRTQIERLKRTLRGDLDNVVMMALRKEPERRYTSAEQIADDVGHYLDGRPVIARTDTLGYRSAKFIRRNRLAVSGAAAFVIVLLAFSVLSAIQARRIAHERDRAEHVSAFLASVFSAANPAEAQGDTLTALELLDRGATRISAELAGQPSVRAHLLDVMSHAYHARGAFERAEALAREALALRKPDDPSLPASLARLAEAVEAQSRFAEADSLYRAVIALRRSRGDFPLLIEALERRGQFLMTSLGPPDSVAGLLDEALSLRRRYLRSEFSDNGRTLLLYANGYHVRGDYQTAERYFRTALEEHRGIQGDLAVAAEASAQLGLIQSFRREYAAADSLLRESAAMHGQIYGRTHPRTAGVLTYLAMNLTSLLRYEEAEPILREVLSIQERHSGRESKDYVSALRTLRRLLSESGQYDKAVDVAHEVVAITAAVYGTENRSYATNIAHHAQVLHNAGRPVEALTEYRRALELLRRAIGPDTPFYATILAETARCLADLSRAGESESLYEEAYAVMQERLSTESYERSRVAYALGTAHAARGNHDRALPLFEDAAAVRVGDSRSSAELAARAVFGVATTLLALDRRDEARPHLLASQEMLRELFGPDHGETLAAVRLAAATQ